MAELRSFTLRYAGTTLYFGVGALEKLRDHVKCHSNVAVVTGKRSAKVSGALDDLVKMLGELNIQYTTYDDVSPNPWVSQADRMAEHVWRSGAEAIIAVGGGSVIDTAKFAAIIAASGGRCADYTRYRRRPARALPLYAVNLTHGTGTEVDRYAVLTTDETREKLGYVTIYPAVSIDDPKYTLTLPEDQSRFTTLDAFYHAYEAATSRYLNSPFVDLVSAEAIRIVKTWLPVLLEDLENLEARYWLLYASMLGGVAIDLAGTHLVHAVEHALSGVEPRLAHGDGLAIVGPRVLYYTHKAVPELSARVLRPLIPELRGTPEEAALVEERVRRFQEENGVRDRLSDFGFGKDSVEDLIRLLFNGLRGMMGGTPFDVTPEIVRDILLRSL